jgi:transcriptional regulator with GAF, ATPase, and Fis domain
MQSEAEMKLIPLPPIRIEVVRVGHSFRIEHRRVCNGENCGTLGNGDFVTSAAPQDVTVLILGESGTGKELIARAIYHYSRRDKGPFLAINCAAIPETLLESELFGHEKGAFTDAHSTRAGKFEAAGGGTLFLDEIGELPLPAQARLLRVLQEGEVRRVGATGSRRVNVRLLAATHRDLRQMSYDGQFRNDLYFRLRVVEISLPALRARGADVLELADFLLRKTCRRLNKPPLELTHDARQAIFEHPWPGNVRELENALESVLILAQARGLEPVALLHDLHAPAVGGRTGRRVRSGADARGGRAEFPCRRLWVVQGPCARRRGDRGDPSIMGLLVQPGEGMD